MVKRGRERTSLFITAVAVATAVFFQPALSLAVWEPVRSFYGAGGSEHTTPGFSLTQTVGEAAAAVSAGASPSASLLSGYLSKLHTENPSFSITTFEAAGTMSSEGVLWGAGQAAPVSLAFNNEVSPATAISGIIVTELLDRLGNQTNSTEAASVSYNPATNSAVISPAAASWPPGSLFAVYYSSGFTDISGLPLAAGATRYFTTMMSGLQDNIAAVPGDLGARLSVPAGAYAGDFLVMISTSQADPVISAANSKLSALPGGIQRPLRVLNLSVRDGNGVEMQPETRCVLSLPYRDDNGDGLVDGAFPPARAKDLAVWHLDEGSGSWVKQTGAIVDTAAKRVFLSVTHFSSYALMAVPDTDVSLVHAYPVPFRPNAGNTARYGSWSDLITFTQLPSSGKIKIYTAAGALVRELAITPPSMKWDLKNSGGQTVASGVYLWEVSSGDNRKTGKLIVIK